MGQYQCGDGCGMGVKSAGMGGDGTKIPSPCTPHNMRSRVLVPVTALSGNNLGQVVHTHVPLSPSSVILCRSRGGDAVRPGR